MKLATGLPLPLELLETRMPLFENEIKNSNIIETIHVLPCLYRCYFGSAASSAPPVHL